MNTQNPVQSGLALPNRRQFLCVLGKVARLACAVGFQLPGWTAGITPALSKRALLEILEAVENPTRVITQPDGTEVLLLPYDGRLLGLFARGSEEDLNWMLGDLSLMAW